MRKRIKKTVKKSYAEIVKKSNTCCSSSCCSPAQQVSFLKEEYKNIEGYQEIADYGLGCGLPTEVSNIKEGDTVLDLGSGAGIDAFIARNKVGESGKVIGIDFTEEMIKKANENKNKLGFHNVEFILGDIENLPVASNSIDVVISNCVMNLIPDKENAYKEIFRVLKPGGHFSISDVVLNTKLPKGILNAAEMYVACVSGALEKNNYLKIIEKTGFKDIEIKEEHDINLSDKILLQFISKKELEEYRKKKSPIISITITARKT